MTAKNYMMTSLKVAVSLLVLSLFVAVDCAKEGKTDSRAKLKTLVNQLKVQFTQLQNSLQKSVGKYGL